MRGIFPAPSFKLIVKCIQQCGNLYIWNANEEKYPCHSALVIQSSPLCIRIRNCLNTLKRFLLEKNRLITTINIVIGGES